MSKEKPKFSIESILSPNTAVVDFAPQQDEDYHRFQFHSPQNPGQNEDEDEYLDVCKLFQMGLFNHKKSGNRANKV